MLSYHEVNSIIWSLKYLFLEFPQEFGFFESKLLQYLEKMVDTQVQPTSAFNMVYDISTTIKLAKQLTIIDPEREKYKVFWREFFNFF